MDIKKKVYAEPKKLDRTIKKKDIGKKTVKKGASLIHTSKKGVNSGKDIEQRVNNSDNRNEGEYATDQVTRSARNAGYKSKKAPQKLKHRVHELKKNTEKMRKHSVYGADARGQAAASMRGREARDASNGAPASKSIRKHGVHDAGIKKQDSTSTHRQGTRGVASQRHAKAPKGRRGGRAVSVCKRGSGPALTQKQTVKNMKRQAYRKNAIKNSVKRMSTMARSTKRGVTAIIRGAITVFRAAKSIWLLMSIAGGGTVAIIAIVGVIVAAVLSPFSFLFGGNEPVDNNPSLAEVANDINAEYTAKFNSIIDDHDYVDEVIIEAYETDSAIYVACNWKDILSIWSINNDMYRGEKEQPSEEAENVNPDELEAEQEELAYVMTDKNIKTLTNLFWEMNDIQYEIKTEEIEVEPGEQSEPTPTRLPLPSASPTPEPTPETKTVKTLIITPQSNDYLWGADRYNFDDEQRSWLDDLMSDEYHKEWSRLLMGIVGTEITEVQQALLDSLPAALGGEIALNASTRLGNPYSQPKRGQGLYVDCSYLARWCYLEAGYDWFTPGTAAEQARFCYNHNLIVGRNELKAGDLLFYSFAKNGRFKNVSHVAIYIGRASDGKEYMIDASSSHGFVIYREVFTDKNLVFCGRPLEYLD